MRVLLLDSDRPDVERAVEELDRAGHTVARCCEIGPARCHLFLTDTRCPLNATGIDVALIVRNHPWPGLPLERGAVCMVRAGVPIAVVESPSSSAVEACESGMGSRPLRTTTVSR
jgi:hypothetical protein